MLAKLKELVTNAEKGKYAIGAFNVFNLESAQAVARSAADLHSPVIIQVSETTIDYAGLKTIANIVRDVAEIEAANVPIALHLDHGRSFRSIMECIRAGFSSVQIDASDLPFTENLTLTRSVVEFAHKHNVAVQGEVGKVPGTHGQKNGQVNKECQQNYTDPREAQEFVKATEVDTLAVAVGTVHGLYRSQINFSLLKKISKLVDVPLVLHGASGTQARDIRKAIRCGIREINIDTELRIASIKSIKKFIKNYPDETDPRDIMSASREAIKGVVKEKIKVFRSQDKA